MSKETYLGETQVNISETPYKDYKSSDWALYFIMEYGGIDGAHHKDWVLDQVARILNGADITIKKAEWTDHEPEYCVSVGDSNKYHDWVAKLRNGEDGPETYDYEEGIAP